MKIILKISLCIIILDCIIVIPTVNLAVDPLGNGYNEWKESHKNDGSSGTSGGTVSGLMTDVESETNTNIDSDSLTSVISTVLGFLQVISGLLSVVIIAVAGFKYITETPDMKNEVKKTMVPIVVGLLLVFFATTIAKFFVGVFEH